jgi:hypothetical protein
MESNYFIHKYEQSIPQGKIVILLADSQVESPNDIMREAVSKVVKSSMYNEMIDASLRRPYLRLLLIGDINTLQWKKYDNGTDCDYVEFDLKNDGVLAGRVVFMRGGLYQPNPYEYMTNKVKSYLCNLDNTVYKTYNELIEEPLDNPWFRVILLNINNLVFQPFL